MKKRLTIPVIAALCIASMAIGAAASGVITKITAELRPDFTVVVDGKVQTFKNAQGEKVEPILYEGTTYLPLRAIGELMGKKVYWYEADKRIELKTEQEPTVTDADVIITEDDGNDAAKKDKVKEDKAKPEKEENKVDKKVDEKDREKPAVEDEIITAEQAKEIVLKKADLAPEDVEFKKLEKDYDDGIIVYEIEFFKGTVEYEAEVNAKTGAIIDWDVDVD